MAQSGFDLSDATMYPAYTDKEDMLADLVAIQEKRVGEHELFDIITKISNTDVSGISNPTSTHY